MIGLASSEDTRALGLGGAEGMLPRKNFEIRDPRRTAGNAPPILSILPSPRYFFSILNRLRSHLAPPAHPSAYGLVI